MPTYTGHALVDVGIATLVAHARRNKPEELTTDDLARAAKWLARLYTEPGPMRDFARGTVFLNAGYTSSPDPEVQRQHIARVLEAWLPGTPVLHDEKCLFCGRPAVYRANREDVPLLNGRDVYNFSPGGRAGTPVCGLCSLALQMLPLGCVKSGGNLIAAHSNDPRLTLSLARAALKRTEQVLTLTTIESLPGLPYERTRLVEMLVDWLAASDRLESSPSLTGYVFTNTGQNPSIRIYPLHSGVVGFLEAVLHHPDKTLTDAWKRAVQRAWNRPDEPDQQNQANTLYEALLKLPEGARRLFRTHLMPVAHWGLVALYLRRVMNMEHEKITLLRDLGERFATYALEKRAFFYQFSRTDEYSRWRRLVLRAADDSVRLRGQSLITFDEFVDAFTAPPGEINDWRLARDLVTLVMIEKRLPDSEALFEDLTETDDIDGEDAES